VSALGWAHVLPALCAGGWASCAAWLGVRAGARGAQVKVVVGIDSGWTCWQRGSQGPCARGLRRTPRQRAAPPWSAPRARKGRDAAPEDGVLGQGAGTPCPLTPAPSIPQEQGLSLACGKYFLCGRVVQAVGACEESCLFLGALWVGCADSTEGLPADVDERRLDVKAQANPSWEEQELSSVLRSRAALLCRGCLPVPASCLLLLCHASVCPMLPCAPCFPCVPHALRVPHASVCPCFRVPHASVCRPCFRAAPCSWPPHLPLTCTCPPAQRGPLPVPVARPRVFPLKPPAGWGRWVPARWRPSCAASAVCRCTARRASKSGEGGRQGTQGAGACWCHFQTLRAAEPQTPTDGSPQGPPSAESQASGRPGGASGRLQPALPSLSLTRQGAPLSATLREPCRPSAAASPQAEGVPALGRGGPVATPGLRRTRGPLALGTMSLGSRQLRQTWRSQCGREHIGWEDSHADHFL